MENGDHIRTTTGKFFVGGLAFCTTEESLCRYFSNFGEVFHCLFMRDIQTGKSRGFAYMTMKDSNVIERILQYRPHIIDGKVVECKIAIPKPNLKSLKEDINNNTSSSIFPGASKTKLFVGGLPSNCDREELIAYFSKFGKILDCSIVFDKLTGQSRGFGFMIFEKEESVNAIMSLKNTHSIRGKWVDCKKALPKETAGDAVIPVANDNTFQKSSMSSAEQIYQPIAYMNMNIQSNGQQFNEQYSQRSKQSYNSDSIQESSNMFPSIGKNQRIQLNPNSVTFTPSSCSNDFTRKAKTYYNYKLSSITGERLDFQKKMPMIVSSSRQELFRINEEEKKKYEENDNSRQTEDWTSENKLMPAKDYFGPQKVSQMNLNKFEKEDRNFKPY